MSSDKYECFNLKGQVLYPESDNMTLFSVDMITTMWLKTLTEKEVFFG
jgi:hypothetical protein